MQIQKRISNGSCGGVVFDAVATAVHLMWHVFMTRCLLFVLRRCFCCWWLLVSLVGWWPLVLAVVDVADGVCKVCQGDSLNRYIIN